VLPPLPLSIPTWTGNGDGTSWGNSGNWTNGIPASNGDDSARFEGLASEQATVNLGGDRKLKSLWFNAGTFYTIGSNTGGEFTLSGGNSGTYQGQSGNYLVVVVSDGTKQSEHNIESTVNFDSLPANPFILNYSEGGLRFGGKFKIGDFDLTFGGSGATHIAGRILAKNEANWANSNFDVIGDSKSRYPTHLILSGYNDKWGGKLKIHDLAFVVAKSDLALGAQSNNDVNQGGTLAFRSHLETPLSYQKHPQDNYIELYHQGTVRAPGLQRIGAIYNDGGQNTVGKRISVKSQPNPIPTGFGSRGDRGGYLSLTNEVRLSTEFWKLGPGLIILANELANKNEWDKDTVLLGGVLRLSAQTSRVLPNASTLVFNGGVHGGILELGWEDFSRSLGTGNNQVRWTGDGGFSAYGAAREVKIVDAQNNLVSLTWGSTADFLGDGHALLLSSRYANDVITFTNAIDLNGQSREVRVARGESAAHARLSGVLSGSGGGLLKTSDGLLYLTGSNTYTGASEIRGGALRGVIPDSSNIVLNGGVLGVEGDITPWIGTGGWQINWQGHGGFAAYSSGEVTLRLNNDSGNYFNWGSTANFVGNGQELRFGHYTASGTLRLDNNIDLGSLDRTIRVERAEANKASGRADVILARKLKSEENIIFSIVGDGVISYDDDGTELWARNIWIHGAELRLTGDGNIAVTTVDEKAAKYDIRYGGTLTLDNNQRSAEADRIHNESAITLAAGNLNLLSQQNTDVTEKVGDLILDSGANSISITGFEYGAAELYIESLLHDLGSRATLDVTFNPHNASRPTTFRLQNSASGHGINDSTGDEIIPWAISVDSWLTAQIDNSHHYLKPLVNYYEAQTGWTSSHNVRVNSGTINFGPTSRTINSLVLGGNLNLGSRQLKINSGGFLVTGDRSISGSGSITSGTPSGGSIRPLYIHTSGSLTFSGSARLSGGMDVVKTRAGSLILGGSGTHEIGSLYIHDGTVEVSGSGKLRVGAGDHRIYIGDGAGTDRLILPGGRWNPIIKEGGGLPSITLRGTPYDPRGPEYGGDQAILQLGGNGGSDGKTYGAGTKQRLANLHIDGRGTIDWRGGEVGLANILWIDELSFSGSGDILFIRNWYEYEDLFLVKKVHNGKVFDTALLPQIVFEGYQDYVTTLKDYDKDYWQITPFGGVPEPATYGAILAAVGLSLWIWRKKRAASAK